MFIDIHAHVRRLPGPLRGGKPAYATPEQLLARYDTIGVERAVLLPGGFASLAALRGAAQRGGVIEAGAGERHPISGAMRILLPSDAGRKSLLGPLVV